MSRLSRHWLWLLLALPVAFGLWRLRFDVEVLNLLPSRSPAVRGLKLYQENFANARELIITVHAGEADQAEAAARAIAEALRRATNLAASAHWQPPWLEHPGQSAELAAFLWFNQPPAVFAELTNRLADSAIAASLAEAREQLATGLSPDSIARSGYDPFNLTRLPASVAAGAPALGDGQEFFASADGTFRVVFVESALDLASYRACLAWLNEVKAIVESARSAEPPFGANRLLRSDTPNGSSALHHTVEVHYTGRPAFVAEIAGGMERDMTGSVAGTLVIIAVLFALVHRSALPLLWLVTLLVLILGATMALGGLIYGPINVVSMGFAAILLGLGVDYGLVLYQEAQAAPHVAARDIRREAGSGIIWSAVTTAGAFLILNLSSLPGLAQLGTLVAIGVALAAVVMLFAYLPPLRRTLPPHPGPLPLGGGEGDARGAGSKYEHDSQRQPADDVSPSPVRRERAEVRAVLLTRLPAFGIALAAAGLVLHFILHRPAFDHSTDALRPRHSSAHAALDEIKRHISGPREPLWLLVPGRDEAEVARRLDALASAFHAASNKPAATVTVPTALWPNPANQSANRPALAAVVARESVARQAALARGFTTNSLALTESLFTTWRTALAATNTFWPANDSSRWALDKLAARTARGSRLRLPLRGATEPPPAFVALALVYPVADTPEEIATLSRMGAAHGAFLSGWQALGIEVFDLVKRELPRVLLPMGALLLASLWLAFRRPGEVALSLASLAFAGLLLHLVMRACGWSWNLMNLMALPLLLGAGVDYSIHMQLALRRHAGDARAVRRTVGRALFLCAATTVAGFGSLAWSSNAGLASLGQVCAAGVACAYLTAVFVLPVWWKALGEIQSSKLKAQGKPQ